jgi:hypothetical protein
MAELEIIALDEAGAELEAPQAGDTYVAKRDVSVEGNITYVAKRDVSVEGNITVTGTVDGRDVAADGALAATAIQPADNISTLTNDSGFQANVALASQAEAQAGTENTKTMTALRVAEAIDAQAPAYVLHKTDATVSPAITNDSSEGYSAGSLWINLTGDAAWVCVDPLINTAVWLNIGLAPGDLHAVATSGDSDDLTEGAVKLLLTVAERALIAGAVQEVDEPIYAIMSVQAGSVGESTVDGTPRKIAAWNTNGLANDAVPDQAGDDITAATDGIYHVDLCVSFSGTASKTYQLEIYRNGLSTGFAFDRKLGTGGDVGSGSCHAILILDATDTVEVYQSSSDGGTAMTVTEAQLSITRVGPQAP